MTRIDYLLPVLPLDWQERLTVCLVQAPSGADPWQLASLLPEPTVGRELASRFRHSGRLAESVLARLALAELRRRVVPVESMTNFSLSHTRQSDFLVAAAAISECPVGIDIEFSSRLKGRGGLLSRIVSDGERRELQGLDQERQLERALQLWCAKESLSKAIGTGLEAPLEQYEARIVSNLSQGIEVSFENFVSWRCVVLVYHSLFIGLCLPRDFKS